MLEELLEKDIEFEKEPDIEYKKPTPPIKLNMNRVLDLIMAHYHYVTTGLDEEWDRQLKGFVNAIPDEKIREHFKRQITFFGDQEKLLFYGWGQEV
ncbi:MAG: hypothetical protein IJ593_11530 [Lachnospiraceae bacterium]|nr:hypothetical protein [Lachnospiraceae bacterium]